VSVYSGFGVSFITDQRCWPQLSVEMGRVGVT